MESSDRAALSLVRLVAGCFIVIGLLDLGLYFTQWLHPQHRLPLNILRIILDSIPILIGIVIFIKAKALAEWLSDLIQ
jgi:hypothetical protein